MNNQQINNLQENMRQRLRAMRKIIHNGPGVLLGTRESLSEEVTSEQRPK